MYAYQGNLLDPNDPDPREFSGFDFHHFDIAVVGLGFHHFDDPALAAQRLVERLRPGGVLLILDFLPHGKVADVRLFFFDCPEVIVEAGATDAFKMDCSKYDDILIHVNHITGQSCCFAYHHAPWLLRGTGQEDLPRFWRRKGLCVGDNRNCLQQGHGKQA